MSDRWQQVEKLCQSALELEESQRAGFLKEACAGDNELRQEVESLLKFDGRGNQFIEEPALEVAARMMAQEKPESLLGQQLGSYQVLSLLGSGGMGVVYKARDARLKRSVAIKVLPADSVSDPERKRRFIQEARAASALNHPNIITIHDIGSESGIDFVVMEYVAGKTLDQWIPHKGMPLSETLKLAIQMADALAKAHSAGIVHRDLKPTNVMVTDEGLVKVLDFGLAKLTEMESDEGGTHTTQPQTETGTIIGTVSYMSPEQAEGKKVDARSDIFSFGAVLYEMVTGQKAFEGDSKMSTLAAVLKQEPKPISQRVSGTTPDLEKIITRCLRKVPERRWQTMADIKVAIQELREETDIRPASRTSALQARQPWIWAGATFVVVAIAIATWLFRGTPRKPQAAPEVVPLTSYVGSERDPSFSPDGNQVVFSWNGAKQDNFDIYIKLIGSPTPLRLTTDPATDVFPAFSPDGRSIGFVRESKGHATFVVIPSIGGPERLVAELATFPYPERPFSWFPDSKWVATDGLALLSIESGDTRPLTSPPKLSRDFSPAISPDGRTIAFSRSASFQASDIYLLNLSEGLKPRGEPRRLTFLKGLNFHSAWTPSGSEIIFASGVFWGDGMSLWRAPASGIADPEQLPYTTGGEAFLPAISRSGSRLAYVQHVESTKIWRLALLGQGVASALPIPFITSTRGEGSPQYSPDGKRIAFESSRSGVQGIWISDADGSKVVELFSRSGVGCGDARWSPDGQQIVFSSNLEGNFDIYVIRASGGKPIRLTSDPADDIAGSWSRDGKWIYFTSQRTGRWEVWKVSAGGGEAVRVTRNGGRTAFESTNGKALYYTKGDDSTGLWKMPVSGGEESQVLPSVVEHSFSVGSDGVYFISKPGANGKFSIQFLNFSTSRVKMVAGMSAPPEEGLSVSPDGRFLLFTQFDENEAISDLMLVENFK